MCSGAKPDLPPMPSSLSLEGLATLVLAYLPLTLAEATCSDEAEKSVGSKQCLISE